MNNSDQIIKLRAWNKFHKKMYEVYEINFEHNIAKCRDSKGKYTFWFIDLIIEQYTGMVDRDGIELYRGDIIFSENWSPNHYKVVFFNGAFGFGTDDNPYVNDIDYVNDFVKVGNIHENPELLK